MSMTPVESNKLDQTVQLRSQRQLGYAEYGSKQGFPIFYFTGGNSSRFEGQWFNQAVDRQGIRLIVPDRPGFGLSTFLSGRRLLDWPDDVIQLADFLSIERFSVFGLSGGGPHVLATLTKAPDRINRAAVVSGTAPPEMPDRFEGMWFPVRLIFLTARYSPSINQLLLKQMSLFYSDPEQMNKRMKQSMPIPDKELLERRPDILEIFTKATQEAHCNGIEGDALEWQLYVRPWGFQMEDIQIPIKLWYGRFDQQVPVGMGRYLVKRLPQAQLIEVDDGGHFSTVNNHIDEIFSYLSSRD